MLFVCCMDVLIAASVCRMKALQKKELTQTVLICFVYVSASVFVIVFQVVLCEEEERKPFTGRSSWLVVCPYSHHKYT